MLAGFFAGWGPWLLYQNRTVFAFYAIVFLPYMIMALVLSLAVVRGKGPEVDPRGLSNRNLVGIALLAIFAIAVVLTSWWFYPIWVAEPLPYTEWYWRMWFPTWV